MNRDPMDEGGASSINLDLETNKLGLTPYSMNTIEGVAISTIHVTPEEGFSYASFESVGYDLKVVKLSPPVERVLLCFQPNEYSIYCARGC
ncbi:hypothetical protein RHGRI_037018 [Rhododendron griersonianum]|uniref:Uncharacterized protein n=1 Tax=Rhododendron griersonianum TaxID=479676 RepID=A0AAV6HTE5_9ERIC|nr:hypothetical protein RHGRI_037018 [Rhododendron griersonianum]